MPLNDQKNDGDRNSADQNVDDQDLGENSRSKFAVDSSVAYVAQQPWIQNATLRENILFHSEFDAKKYEKVIRACALKVRHNVALQPMRQHVLVVSQ